MSRHQPSAGAGARTGEHGVSMVISILFLAVLLGMSAILIDGGSWFWIKRSMQGDADAAALAAVRELPTTPGSAYAVAKEYAEIQNMADNGKLESFASDTARMRVMVTVGNTAAATPFGRLLGLDQTAIRARATARIAQVSTVDAVLPFAALEGTLEYGNPPIPEKITVSPGRGPGDGLQTGHIGAIAPKYDAPSCTSGTGNSAAEVERLIIGAHDDEDDGLNDGDALVACGPLVGTDVNTATGARPNAVRDGFNRRFGSTNGTHTDLFADTVSWDPTSQRFIVEKPDSPRIGFIPIVSTGPGVDDWSDISGTSRPVRVIDYVMVYIGHTDLTGQREPAYLERGSCIPTPCVGNQLQVFLTPIRGMIPPNFNYELRDGWDPNSSAPLAITLVE